MERPEPAFQKPDSGSLHLRSEAGRLLAHLEMHLARKPDDLTSHTRRILIAGQLGDGEATYGALVDLFIVLGERGVGSTILNAAADHSADLIVMGAYGHSKLREWAMGGATASILASMTVPIMFSH